MLTSATGTTLKARSWKPSLDGGGAGGSVVVVVVVDVVVDAVDGPGCAAIDVVGAVATTTVVVTTEGAVDAGRSSCVLTGTGRDAGSLEVFGAHAATTAPRLTSATERFRTAPPYFGPDPRKPHPGGSESSERLVHQVGELLIMDRLRARGRAA